MLFTNIKDKKVMYEVDINIKSYGDISKKDVERINKIVLLSNSLGFEKDTTEEFYRKTSDGSVEPLLMPVKKCKSCRRKNTFWIYKVGLTCTTSY